MCSTYGEQIQGLIDLENTTGSDGAAALSMPDAHIGSGMVDTSSYYGADPMYRTTEAHAGGPAPTMLTTEQLMSRSSPATYQHQRHMQHFQARPSMPLQNREYGGNVALTGSNQPPRPSRFRGVTCAGLRYEASVMIGGRCGAPNLALSSNLVDLVCVRPSESMPCHCHIRPHTIAALLVGRA
jgi:hypothetical protein